MPPIFQSISSLPILFKHLYLCAATCLNQWLTLRSSWKRFRYLWWSWPFRRWRWPAWTTCPTATTWSSCRRPFCRRTWRRPRTGLWERPCPPREPFRAQARARPVLLHPQRPWAPLKKMRKNYNLVLLNAAAGGTRTHLFQSVRYFK